MNSDPKILKHAFDVLATVIRNIDPHNIYNMDEKGLQMGKSARVKVICVRGRRSPPLMTDGDRELVTAIETVAADGTVLPPMLIYKGQGQYAQWHKYLNEEDADTVFCYSPKGWTSQILGLDYLKLLFDPCTRKKLKGNEKRLLIADGHNSHFSLDFLTYCEENRIELFCLPAHTTHILQPLDVGLFGPLQSYYGRPIFGSLVKLLLRETLYRKSLTVRVYLPLTNKSQKQTPTRGPKGCLYT